MTVRNENGSVLVIVLGFVLAFSLLGVGSMHHSYTQSEIAEKEKASAEAFWWADGALERAAQKLSVSLTDLIEPDKDCVWNEGHPDYPNCGVSDSYGEFGDGVTERKRYYRVMSTATCVCDPSATGCVDDSKEYALENCTAANGQVSSDSRKIRAISWVNVPYSDGTNNDQFRRILAKFGSYDIENAITTHGTINEKNGIDCQPWGSATIGGECVPYAEFTFETIFNGMSFNDFVVFAAANPIPVVHPFYDDGALPWPFVNHVYHLDSTSDEVNIDGRTVIFYEGINTYSIRTTDTDVYTPNNASLLIVDTGYVSGQSPKLDFAGMTGSFCGIVWIIGKVQITGNATINGAVFVDEDPPSNTKVTGTPDVIYSQTCIEGAIAELGGTGSPSFYAWNEYTL